MHMFRTYLPSLAEDIYYRDEIGNISTSHVRKDAEHVTMEIIPRFPLFGGWKTNFYIGYNLPLSEVLGEAGSYLLNVSLGKDFDIDVVIEELVVKVILPEGAKAIKSKALGSDGKF